MSGLAIRHLKNIDIDDEFIKVSKKDTIFEIASKMEEKEVCDLESDEMLCTPILAAYVLEGKKPVGVIYKKDIIKSIIIDGKDPKKTTASQVMNEPICLSVNDGIEDAVNVILDKGLLTIAILDGDEFSSVISVFDAIYLRETIDDMELS
ncbi:MAG: CBS domain-containing protein [Candidatus Hodarchaeota archaeon]